MVERRRRAPFVEETPARFGVLGQLGGKELERRWALKEIVGGKVDDAHPTLPQRGFDFVMRNVRRAGLHSVQTLNRVPRRADAFLEPTPRSIPVTDPIFQTKVAMERRTGAWRPEPDYDAAATCSRAPVCSGGAARPAFRPPNRRWKASR